MFRIESDKQKFCYYLLAYIKNVSALLFNASLVTFIVFFLLETFKTGLISNYFDLNRLLIIGLIFGVIMLVFGDQAKIKPAKFTDYLNSFVFAILLTLYVYSYLSNLGPISVLYSLFSGLIFFVIINLFIYAGRNQD